MLFLSLGSNYTFRQGLRHMFTIGRKGDAGELQKVLTGCYQGQKTLLFSKGRGALAAAVRLATGGEGAVVVTSLTCYSVIDAVRVAGCEVVYADISPETLNVTEQTLSEAMKGRNIKAVIVQNTLGIAMDIDMVLRLAREADAAVIEDVAHAVGGRYDDGREIGTVGDYTMLSFGRDKLLDTINGGALVIRTDRTTRAIEPPLRYPGLLQQMRDRLYPAIGWWARTLFPLGLGKYVLAVAYKTKLARRSADGAADMTLRLPHWQAKLALKQMRRLDEAVESRRKNQQQYLAELKRFSPKESSNAVRTPLLLENRDEVVAALKTAGYFTEDIWYDVPVSPQRLYHMVEFPEADFPAVTEISARTINLPTHQLVTSEDIRKINEIITRKGRAWNR